MRIRGGGIAVLDNLLIGSPTGAVMVWTGAHPSMWSSEPNGQPNLPRIHAKHMGGKGRDWWEDRRALRASIISIMMGQEDLLSVFDDTELITQEVSVEALLNCGITERDRRRYFDSIPGDNVLVRLRRVPPEEPDQRERDKNHTPLWFHIMCPRGEVIHRMCMDEGLYDAGQAVIRGFQGTEYLLLPHGGPHLSTDGTQILLPAILQRSGCSCVDIYRDPDAVGHVVKLPGCTSGTDLYSIGDLIQTLMKVQGPGLHELLVTPGKDSISFCIATSHTVPDVHAILTAFFCFLNPLVSLDEAVSIAVAACMLVFQDNRTMSPDHLAMCFTWHSECWRRVFGVSPIQRITLRVSRRNRRGWLNTPSCVRLVLRKEERAPLETIGNGQKRNNKKVRTIKNTDVGELQLPVDALPVIQKPALPRRNNTRGLLAALNRTVRWGKRLHNALECHASTR